MSTLSDVSLARTFFCSADILHMCNFQFHETPFAICWHYLLSNWSPLQNVLACVCILKYFPQFFSNSFMLYIEVFDLSDIVLWMWMSTFLICGRDCLVSGVYFWHFCQRSHGCIGVGFNLCSLFSISVIIINTINM